MRLASIGAAFLPLPWLTAARQHIDHQTPRSVHAKTSSKGEKYKLVFSDEFEQEGRTFGPGDDPFFEAVDLHYWQTGDLERYSPDAAFTRDGRLIVRMTKEDQPCESGVCPLKSAMLQSWNKLCFQGGILEFRASLPGYGEPGDPLSMGYWPGLWINGNLGRAGYGATTDGMWPYTYDSCDSAVNQSSTVSELKPQRINKCVKNPGYGMNPHQGRGAPEIDILEGQVSSTAFASQSFQLAPFSEGQRLEASAVNYTNAQKNPWLGSRFQQAASANAFIPTSAFGGAPGEYLSSAVFAVEYVPGPQGYIRWSINGQETWTLDGGAVGPDDIVGQRSIPEEPMYIVMNLAAGKSWGGADPDTMVFPAELAVDYVRLYQPAASTKAVSCDPRSHPTAKYIAAHPRAYQNHSARLWNETGYSVPDFKLPPSQCSQPCGRGFCSLRTGECVCNVGFKGAACNEPMWEGTCQNMVTDASCEPFAYANSHDIFRIFEWICDTPRKISQCDDIDLPKYKNCTSAAKATYVMTHYYNHYKGQFGDSACCFGGAGRLLGDSQRQEGSGAKVIAESAAKTPPEVSFVV